MFVSFNLSTYIRNLLQNVTKKDAVAWCLLFSCKPHRGYHFSRTQELNTEIQIIKLYFTNSLLKFMKKLTLCILLLGLICFVSASAQTYGSLTGKVTDDDGKPIVGATIKVGGTKLGANSKAPNGNYTILRIPPGKYEVTITSVGFQTETKNVSISIDEDEKLDVKLSSAVKVGKTVEVTAKKITQNRGGSVKKIDSEKMSTSTRNSISGVLGLSTQTAGVANGVSIRGGRPTETTIKVDGVDISDPVLGGLGTSINNYPMVSGLGVEQIQVLSSGFSVKQGDVLSGSVNSTTKAGKNNKYEGALQFSMPLPALYGKTSEITVKKVGTDQDTTLAPVELNGSGRKTYEFQFSGPIPGFNSMTFSVSGILSDIKYRSAGYEVYDMSQEYADARKTAADQLWGYHLDPINLGQLPHQKQMSKNINGKLKYDINEKMFLELSGEYGTLSYEVGDWTAAYRLDHPVFFKPNGDTDRVDMSLLERDMNQVNQNIFVQRLSGKYNMQLDETSFLEFNGSYVVNKNEVGKKDESKTYGLFSTFDIYEPIDADGDVIIDRYAIPDTSISHNRYDVNTYSSKSRNKITGLYEGGEVPGASKNPYGLTDLNFPTHGNDRQLDFRNTTRIKFDGEYNSRLDLGDVKATVLAGFDFESSTMRRHYNSLPWDQKPFFDVIGYQTNYFKDRGAETEAFFEKPFTPYKGAFYAATKFDYKSIIFEPGVRFDFFNANTYAPPSVRSKDVLNDLSGVPNATLKFQASPRVNVSYPITEKSEYRVNFAMVFKMPELTALFDNAYGDATRGNQLFGNPDIKPQKVFAYEMGYKARVGEEYDLDIAAYYRDIYNQLGVQYVPAIPDAYSIFTVTEYGNVRGIELSLSKGLSDNYRWDINYRLQKAVGTASNAGANFSSSPSIDPFTEKPLKKALTEYPLDFDQTHNLNATLGLQWRSNEGPSLGGIRLLENTGISFTGIFTSGLPYTLVDAKGNLISGYYSENLPSSFSTEMHIERSLPLKDLIGDALGNTTITAYLDIFNVFNETGVSSYRFTDNASRQTVLASPDDNGTSFARGIGEFTATPYYKDIDPNRTETYSASQYDEFGSRYYNPYADLNLDGVVTQIEKYEGYRKFIATIQALRGTYRTPRTVNLGLRLRF